MRWFPWLVSLTLTVAGVSVAQGGLAVEGFGVLPGVGEDARATLGALSATPTPGLPSDACRQLYSLSEQAAALTGSLALAGSQERPTRARRAAEGIRALTVQVVALEGGEGLVGVFSDLADALEAYAAGDPAAAGTVRELSVRNAELRVAYETCWGGEG